MNIIKPFKNRETWGIIIGVASFIIAVIGLLIKLKAEKTELTCEILSSYEVTKIESIPKLTAIYRYNQDTVQNLWKTTLRIYNSGDKTIIGEGNNKTLIHDFAAIYFSKTSKILGIDEISKDFYVNLFVIDYNGLGIFFTQWKKGDGIRLDLYITSDKPDYRRIIPVNSSDDIADGEIVFRDLSNLTGNQKGRESRLLLISNLFMRMLGIAFNGIVFVFAISAVIYEIWNRIKFQLWLSKNLGSFIEYMNLNKDKITFKDYYNFLNQPGSLPDSVWVGFKGKKPNAIYISQNPLTFYFTMLVISLCTIFGLLAMINLI